MRGNHSGPNGEAWPSIKWSELNNLIESLARDLATVRAEKGWTCFHCGDTFTTPGAARDHFGETPESIAGCLIDRVALEEGGKPERGRGLLMALRKAEASVRAMEQERDELSRIRKLLMKALVIATGASTEAVAEGPTTQAKKAQTLLHSTTQALEQVKGVVAEMRKFPEAGRFVRWFEMNALADQLDALASTRSSVTDQEPT
jgi:hypothetical protein